MRLVIPGFYAIVMLTSLFGQSKYSDRDLTFAVTFDRNSTAAEVSLGDGASTTFRDNLEFRIVPGFDGKNAFNRREVEELLRYDVVKNIDHRKGTIAFWVMAKNYSPKDVKTSDKEKWHKPYINIYFRDGANWVQFFIYQYYDDARAFFYWSSSYAAKNMYKLAAAPLLTVGQGDWFQIAVTWDEKEIKMFLNGELQSTKALAAEALAPSDFSPKPDGSFISVRESIWKGPPPSTDAGKETVIDDIKIFSRPLTDLEIKNQYAKVAPGAAVRELVSIDIQLNGVDDGGPLDRLEAIVDMNPLDAAFQKEVLASKAKASYEIKTPKGKTLSGEWPVGTLTSTKIIDGIDEPGEYAFTVIVSSPDGKTERATKKIVRPETSWHNNDIGREDSVPDPWTPMSIDAKNTVRIWNREYHFDKGPFPARIIAGGESILAKAPALVIMTSAGKAAVSYEITERVVKNSFIGLKGKGTANGFSLTWKTRIDFDGFMRTDFEVNGTPTVESMSMQWTVNRKFADFVMDPLLKQSGSGSIEFPFPYDDRKSGTCLWLTSREKGFAWSPEHDGNWIYDKNEKPLRVSVDAGGGVCEVRMITKRTTIPSGAAYHAMFIAPPSRPLPKHSRPYRRGGYARQPHCDVARLQHVGEGTES
ncbi:MAG: glycoside hydrolase domain-containing protein, partial [Spirochaetota bacterium]